MNNIEEESIRLLWGKEFEEIFKDKELSIICLEILRKKIDWDEVSRKLEDEMMLEYFKDYINWDRINACRFSEKFIDKFQDKLNWKDAYFHNGKHNSHSLGFFIKYEKKINWDNFRFETFDPRLIKYMNKKNTPNSGFLWFIYKDHLEKEEG